MAIADTFRNAIPIPCKTLKIKNDSVENERLAPIEARINIMTPAINDFLTPYFPEICPAGSVNTAMTSSAIVGIQFWITLFIPNSLAIDGTPSTIPADRNTAKNDVMNDTNTTAVSKSNFIMNGRYALPDYQDYVSMTGCDILDRQLKAVDECGRVFVPNTSLFLVVDYHPSWFFDDVRPGE